MTLRFRPDRASAGLPLLFLVAVTTNGCYLSSEPTDTSAPSVGIRVDVVASTIGFGVLVNQPAAAARVVAERCSDGLRREAVTDADGAAYLDFDAVDCWTITAVDHANKVAVTLVEASAPLDGPIVLEGAGRIAQERFEWRDLTIEGRTKPESTVLLVGVGAIFSRPGGWSAQESTHSDVGRFAGVASVEAPYIAAFEYFPSHGIDVRQTALVEVPASGPITIEFAGVSSPRRRLEASFTIPAGLPVNVETTGLDPLIKRQAGAWAPTSTSMGFHDVMELSNGDRWTSMFGSEPEELARVTQLSTASFRMPLGLFFDPYSGLVQVVEGDDFQIPPVTIDTVTGSSESDFAVDAGGLDSRTVVTLSGKTRKSTRRYTIRGPSDRPLALQGMPPWPSGASLSDFMRGTIGPLIEVAVVSPSSADLGSASESWANVIIDTRAWH